MTRLRVGVLFGGRSGEHEVSLRSAASVMAAMDPAKFEIVPIGITKAGQWITAGSADRLLKGLAVDGESEPVAALGSGSAVVIPPAPVAEGHGSLAPFQTSRSEAQRAIDVDVIFPVLHGTFGEDGTIQGLLDLADIPYVGAGVLGSAAGMDKDIMKALFRAAGLPIVKHVTLLRTDWMENPLPLRKRIESALKYPLFVKPANLGSSVGVSKAQNRAELGPAIEEAAKFDRKIIIEQGVGGRRKAREIECAVLGNDRPEVSVAGEIIPGKEFYDYAAKYLEDSSQLIIPAKLSRAQSRKLQSLALAAFKAVDCAGLARVDFLMDPKTSRIYLNEINTLPGFTSISMYPKLWAASGVEYPVLIERLIQLALERYAERRQSRYSLP